VVLPEIRPVAAEVVDLMQNVSCDVDGTPVQGIGNYRFGSRDMFSLTVPDDNAFDLWGVPTDTGIHHPWVCDGPCEMHAPSRRAAT
jgi:hypothetical protein